MVAHSPCRRRVTRPMHPAGEVLLIGGPYHSQVRVVPDLTRPIEFPKSLATDRDAKPFWESVVYHPRRYGQSVSLALGHHPKGNHATTIRLERIIWIATSEPIWNSVPDDKLPLADRVLRRVPWKANHPSIIDDFDAWFAVVLLKLGKSHRHPVAREIVNWFCRHEIERGSVEWIYESSAGFSAPAA